MGRAFRFVLIRVVVGEYYSFRPVSLCGSFMFGFVCLEVMHNVDMTFTEFLQELQNFFGVVVDKGLVVLYKVFPYNCNAFLVYFVKHFAFLSHVLLI